MTPVKPGVGDQLRRRSHARVRLSGYPHQPLSATTPESPIFELGPPPRQDQARAIEPFDIGHHKNKLLSHQRKCDDGTGDQKNTLPHRHV